MAYLGIERAHVLGVSMGRMIAQELAINYPEKVNKHLGCTMAKRTEPGGFQPNCRRNWAIQEIILTQMQ